MIDIKVLAAIAVLLASLISGTKGGPGPTGDGLNPVPKPPASSVGSVQ